MRRRSRRDRATCRSASRAGRRAGGPARRAPRRAVSLDGRAPRTSARRRGTGSRPARASGARGRRASGRSSETRRSSRLLDEGGDRLHERFRLLPEVEVPRAGKPIEARVGESVTRRSPFRGSTTTSSVPWWTSVGFARPPSRSYASNVAPAAAWAAQATGSCAVARRCATIRSTSSGRCATVSGASAFSTKRRSATAGSIVAASAMSATVTLGIGWDRGPPGVVHPRTRPPTRSAGRARAPGRPSHRGSSRRHGRARCLPRRGRAQRPRRARRPYTAPPENRSRRCRGCRRGSRRTAVPGPAGPAPSPSARSRGRGSGAAARPAPLRSHAIRGVTRQPPLREPPADGRRANEFGSEGWRGRRGRRRQPRRTAPRGGTAAPTAGS